VNEAWRLVVLFVSSGAGILLAGRLKRFDNLLSLFLSGGFLGVAIGHGGSLLAIKEIFWLPALALVMAAPLRRLLYSPVHKKSQTGSLVLLNGVHTLMGAGLAVFFRGQDAVPIVLWGFAAHELIHKAALVSFLRSLGHSTRQAMMLAALSALFVFGAWILTTLPDGALECIEKLVTLGFAWMGLSHLSRVSSLSRSRKNLWRFWLPAALGFIIFALWH
jgi:hypothetical protein